MKNLNYYWLITSLTVSVVTNTNPQQILIWIWPHSVNFAFVCCVPFMYVFTRLEDNHYWISLWFDVNVGFSMWSKYTGKDVNCGASGSFIVSVMHLMKLFPKELLFKTLPLIIWVLKLTYVQAIGIVKAENKNRKETHIKMSKWNVHRKADILIYLCHLRVLQLLIECYIVFQYYK